MMTPSIYLCILYFLYVPFIVEGSLGDSSNIQRRCLIACESLNCSESSIITFRNNQPLLERIFGWTCSEDCGYECMWKTVDQFQRRGLQIPQFHGKWPFVRLFGIQEPASVLASILNLIPHVYLIMKYREAVNPRTHMYQVWTLYALVSINTWTWSTVFHTKDNNFTEKMDYLSAFSVVSYSLIAFFLKLYGQSDPLFSLGLVSLMMAFFCQHIYYMAIIRFDYGYNMMVNIAVGALNSVCWFAWAGVRWKREKHVKLGVIAILLLNGSILLEILDFPPIWWILDSHALWHFSTAPINFVWYRFITLDSQYESLNFQGRNVHSKLA
ncbi:post-GPI attachment to proteins factor 3 [Lepeophtheirus salmonis]|uniref:post-GPI attachment to proteins factor 3 n=1 Tax=Lepeophtheirus salmonis TaxID=72036 RepID=UPI001AE8EC81|nr:post-GPI attachment to proteins factor 3-like isoform X1 [Lepeophtheirus salmonis]